MRLKNGDPFDIEGDNGEEITFVMTDGTVDEAMTNLDGAQQIVKLGEPRSFSLQTGKPRKLTVTYPFKAPSDEFYESNVTGSHGGDKSVDKFTQVPGMAENSVVYRFSA